MGIDLEVVPQFQQGAMVVLRARVCAVTPLQLVAATKVIAATSHMQQHPRCLLSRWHFANMAHSRICSPCFGCVLRLRASSSQGEKFAASFAAMLDAFQELELADAIAQVGPALIGCRCSQGHGSRDPNFILHD